MNSSLPDIGDVTTTQIGGLEIRLARGGRADGIPILLTSPWPESIYCFASSVESVGEFWLGKLSEHMIQGEFSYSECSKPVGFSHGDFGFVVEPLDNAA